MAADLNLMASNIKDILSTVPGILAAYDHEPQTMSKLPAATLYFDSFGQGEGTISNYEVNWNWTVRIYVPINTKDSQTSQLNLRDLVSNTLNTFRKRNNIDLNGSCLYQVVPSGDVYVVLEQNNPMMVAELTLTATTKESM